MKEAEIVKKLNKETDKIIAKAKNFSKSQMWILDEMEKMVKKIRKKQ